MRDVECLPHHAVPLAPVAMTVMAVMRTVPAVMAADVMRAMPAVVTAHVMMAISAMMVMTAILHVGFQAFTGTLHGRGDAGIVERDCIRLLRRRSHEHQACNGGEAEKLFHVHYSLLIPRASEHARCMGFIAHAKRLGFRR